MLYFTCGFVITLAMYLLLSSLAMVMNRKLAWTAFGKHVR